MTLEVLVQIISRLQERAELYVQSYGFGSAHQGYWSQYSETGAELQVHNFMVLHYDDYESW